MIGVATNFGPNVLVLHNVLQPAFFVVEFVSIAENVATLWSLKLLQKKRLESAGKSQAAV